MLLDVLSTLRMPDSKHAKEMLGVLGQEFERNWNIQEICVAS